MEICKQFERAITNAAKAAYLSKLIEKGITEIKHYNPGESSMLADAVIQSPMPTKLNKLKKTNTEAFFLLEWNTEITASIGGFGVL